MNISLMLAALVAMTALQFVTPLTIDPKTIGLALLSAPALAITPEELKTGLHEITAGIREIRKDYEEKMEDMRKEFDQVKADNAKLRKQILARSASIILKPGEVSEGCALWLAATLINRLNTRAKSRATSRGTFWSRKRTAS
jgi:hypothetical protein